MKNNFKNVIAYVVTMLMVLSSLPAVYAADSADNGLYPDAVHTISADEIDSAGNWIYRELVPDTSCETTDGFRAKGSITTNSTMQDSGLRLSTDAHTGSYSIARTMRSNPGIAFDVAAPGLVAYTDTNQKEYIFSTYMRADCSENVNVTVTPAVNYRPVGGTDNKEGAFDKGTGETSSAFDVKSSWNYFTKRVRMFEADSAKQVTLYLYFSKLDSNNSTTDSTGDESKQIQTLYVDDWSVRLDVPDSFDSSYTKSIDSSSHSTSIANGDTVTFTFSLDIDPRTVRKENITVNGDKNSNNVSAVSVATNETTRETTLTITLDNMQDDSLYNIALPEIKDAWGRDVVGATEASYVCTSSEYTINQDLDASGNWKYRNLVPDEGCEALSDGDTVYFTDYGSTDSGSQYQSNVALCTNDKHSGNASLKRSARTNTGIRFDTDSLATDNYYVSAWLKSDCDGDSCTSVPVGLLWWGYVDDAQKSTYFKTETNKEVKFQATTKWQHFSAAVNSGTQVDNKAGIRIYFGNMDSTNGKTETIGLNTRHIQTIYVDDWDFRLIPDWSVNATGAEYVYDSATGKNIMRYTFDKDIDEWTCTEDLFTGENCTIDDVSVTTNELTRKTTLDVAYTIVGAGEAKIELPEGITDAWGREIEGVDEYAAVSVENGIDKTSGSFYYDISDITSDDYTVLVASFDGSEIIDVTIASVPEKAYKAEGTVDVDGADKVVFYVWETSTIKPLKAQFEYSITQ
ncbi:MAG: hypothetical protein IJ365_02610 [Clostridia bacterium]|nr:hypothetical protein [Clostridia bacterium]